MAKQVLDYAIPAYEEHFHQLSYNNRIDNVVLLVNLREKHYPII